MKKLKTQKGITLIALIITIVVLLILAVVSIGAVQDSNIVGYAQNAAGGYDKAKGNENNTISGYENILSQYANGGNRIGNSEEDDFTPVGNLGKYVKYDANGNGSVADETILWRVLRDDADKVELITADVLGGISFEGTDFNDAKSKYNNAVELMIAECKRVTGIENNIRNVGGPATDTTEIVDISELTIFQPDEGVDLSQYEGENGLKVGDDNFLDDFSQMQISGIVKANNSQQYWLASRYVSEYSNAVRCYLSYINSGNKVEHSESCYVYNNGENEYKSYYYPQGVRPVLTLEGGILEGKTGEGTKTQPIEIY